MLVKRPPGWTCWFKCETRSPLTAQNSTRPSCRSVKQSSHARNSLAKYFLFYVRKILKISWKHIHPAKCCWQSRILKTEKRFLYPRDQTHHPKNVPYRFQSDSRAIMKIIWICFHPFAAIFLTEAEPTTTPNPHHPTPSHRLTKAHKD